MTLPRQTSSGRPSLAQAGDILGLAGAMLTALVIRGLLVGDVFLSDGVVLLGTADSAYHARLAYYSFMNFPAVLSFDPYIAYPDGSPVPWPPLYDWSIAGVARLFGHSTFAFESVAAWASTFFATLTVIPAYGLGRILLGTRAGLAAAWFFAVLPASSLLSVVGHMDHHAAVGFLAACWLWSSVRETEGESGHRVWHAILHGLIVAAMVLVWAGSLLYIGLAEGARLLVGGILWSHRDRLLATSGGALLAAALVAPWVAAAPTPIGGYFSSTSLSWLHVLVMTALGALSAAIAGLEAWRPETRFHRRALRALAATVVIALPLLAIPQLSDALAQGTAFLSGDDVWAPTNPEQQPLFSSTTSELRLRPPTTRFGWFAYLVPLLPLLVASRLRRREGREGIALLLIWTTVLTLLALRQVRYAHDLAMLSSVIFVGALTKLRSLFARIVAPRTASFAVFALTIALLWPAFSKVHIPRARVALQRLASGIDRNARMLSPMESEIRFARSVREATPETSGFLDSQVSPEYGLLVHATFGHSFLYYAHRPVPANNFGPYLDPDKFDDATRFYNEVGATEAIEAFEQLGSRFVVTAAGASAAPMPYAQRLHRGDGYLGGDPVCGPCFRLVTEGPKRGTPSRAMFGWRPRRTFVWYKLFEQVAGARIEVEAQPGTTVKLELNLRTPLDREFTFAIDARAESDGWARLRVPYATDVAPPVSAQGLYRVRIGDRVRPLMISDHAVRSGASISFPAAAAEPSPRDDTRNREPRQPAASAGISSPKTGANS